VSCATCSIKHAAFAPPALLLESLLSLHKELLDTLASGLYAAAAAAVQLPHRPHAGLPLRLAVPWMQLKPLDTCASCCCCHLLLLLRRAASLRASLRRRDHELSKLVMRLVSLQELLNQGQALPLNRYVSYSLRVLGFCGCWARVRPKQWKQSASPTRVAKWAWPRQWYSIAYCQWSEGILPAYLNWFQISATNLTLHACRPNPLPLDRYMRYEGAATVAAAASYM
jgi:hypothetical protein